MDSNFTGAILINPWNLNEIKRSLKIALTLSETQKLNDHSHLLSYVKKFTSSHWGKTFVFDLTMSGMMEPKTTQVPNMKLSDLTVINQKATKKIVNFYFYY